ncbi:hypothetical protein TNCV_4957971 [Trichonephila clavipes]|nr:hypothetical protein TNCV_4957971 [Trichonephila clavipes]
MRARDYCAHPDIRDHWALRCMSRFLDQVVSLKRDPQCLSPKEAWYSFTDPLQKCFENGCRNVGHDILKSYGALRSSGMKTRGARDEINTHSPDL